MIAFSTSYWFVNLTGFAVFSAYVVVAAEFMDLLCLFLNSGGGGASLLGTLSGSW